MGTEHSRTEQTSEDLRAIVARLQACAKAFEEAAQRMEDKGVKVAKLRNIPLLLSSIPKIESSAAKASLDVQRSVLEAGILEKAKTRAKEALEAERAASRRAKK